MINEHVRKLIEILADPAIGDEAQSAMVKKLLDAHDAEAATNVCLRNALVDAKIMIAHLRDELNAAVARGEE